MKRNSQWSVYDVGPGSGAPLFTGSKTECLKFLAYAMREHRKAYRVEPA